MRKTTVELPDPPVLNEPKSLLRELAQVAEHLSDLANQMVRASNEFREIGEPISEDLLEAQSKARRNFAVLRERILELARSLSLYPQGLHEDEFSVGALRDLLQNMLRAKQGVQGRAKEPAEHPWDQMLPSDVLADVDCQVEKTLKMLAASPAPGQDVLPTHVEEFLDRIISEAIQVAKAQNSSSHSTAPTSIPIPSGLIEPQRLKSESSHPAAAARPTVTEAVMPKAAPPAIPEAPPAAGPTARPTTAGSVWKQTNPEAEKHYQELLTYAEGRLGLARPEFADLLANLALLSHKRGNYDDAEDLHRKELLIREDYLGPEHPKVATSLNNLALLCRDQGKYAEAQKLWERSLAIVETAFGPEHPKTALRLGNLADLLYACGEHDRAEQYYRRLLAIREKGSVGARREIKASLKKYAELLRGTQRKKEAGEIEDRIFTPRPGWLPKWR